MYKYCGQFFFINIYIRTGCPILISLSNRFYYLACEAEGYPGEVLLGEAGRQVLVLLVAGWPALHKGIAITADNVAVVGFVVWPLQQTWCQQVMPYYTGARLVHESYNWSGDENLYNLSHSHLLSVRLSVLSKLQHGLTYPYVLLPRI